MKTLLVTLTLLASTAFASNTRVQYPYYDGVPVNNLCDAGTEYRTIEPIRVCESWTEIPGQPTEGGTMPSDWVCNSYTHQHTTASKTATECVKFGTGEADGGVCYEWGTVARKNTVIAERITSYGEADSIEYFYFTIPACAR